MVIAEWRKDFAGFYKGIDANKVASEIAVFGDEVRPEQVLDAARDEKSELHKCFEWDDTIAAEKYRKEQARMVLRFLVIHEEKKPEDRPQIRVFYKTTSADGYKPTEYIVKKEDEYKALLTRAWGELRAFKQKYSMLTELQEIFDLID